MTTAQTMLRVCASAWGSPVRRIVCTLCFSCLLICAPGCSTGDRLADPAILVSPYANQGDVIWGVAPLRNESGVGSIDELHVTDEIIRQVTNVRGLTALPLNRTIEAMRAMGVASIQTPAEARALAKALGADGIIVGTITAWDPYEPLQLGLSLALYSRSPALDAGFWGSEEDLLKLRRAQTDYDINPARAKMGPLVTASGIFDTANHETLADVQRFATGRAMPDSPLGWRVYVKSMERFTAYVSYRLTRRLLDIERARVATPVATGEVADL